MTAASETEALALLKEAGVSYKRYEHPALHHLGDLGAPKDFIPMKNLLLKTKKDGRFYLFLTMQERIDFKLLAKAIGTSKSQLNFASPEELFSLMAVTPGTVNPLALERDREKRIFLLVDEAVVSANQVAVHPNQNEATVVMTWPDFEKVLQELGRGYQVIPREIEDL
ncbi:YbaK/EbsC family protein [Fructobacillus papyrifericola]|uniref:Prolyl-tRNA editing protein n=1 Tax=Fructobacillus papyrifericola TaxID=2713172 RepID=A0ABS5QRK3_9LACO|nr:YbaK/EbsC family protein [Fructobacillus papyrifericola]MBS9335829.1 prolyl-tRNA editing protein [Fructobacillus papyrifericola]